MAWFDNVDKVASQAPETNRPQRSGGVTRIATVAVVLVGVGVAGFFVARAVTGPSSANATAPLGTPSSPPAVAAPGITRGVRGRGVTGTVSAKSANGQSFTVTLRTGVKETVLVTSSTTFRKIASSTPTAGAVPSANTGSYASLALGDSVVVLGSASGTTVHATSVVIVPKGVSPIGRGAGAFPGFVGGSGGSIGSVTSIDSATKSFVITSRRTGATTTVTATATTTFSAPGSSAAPSFSSLVVGDRVIVAGTTSSSGSETATSVVILPAGGFGGGFGGPSGSGATSGNSGLGGFPG